MIAAAVSGLFWLRLAPSGPPPFDPTLRNPFSPTPESLAAGERVYRVQCEACHGVDGRGTGPAAVTLNPRPVDFAIHARMGHSDALLFHWISYGVEGTAMPAFARRLTAEERWHVINYIRNFRPATE